MSTVTVYRIEATRGPRQGQGPYQASPTFEDDAYEAASEARRRCPGWASHRPSPHEDHGLYGIAPNEFCGFSSKRALREWWSNGALRLLVEGTDGFYALYAYEVPREFVRKGERQAVFVKAEAVGRRRLDPRTLQ